MTAPSGAKPHRPGAREVIDAVLDPGSFVSWDAPVDLSGYDPDYRAELETARERSGADEAVLTGAGTVRGRAVAVIASEFRFLGGSIGRATAARIVAAVERATVEGLPLLAAPATGGTRMQEGTAAFVEMVPISRAILEHKGAGLPYLVYLRHPTTGGVFASWGSLGHLTVAEPGALIGFLGPRVHEAVHGEPFPPGIQLAEHLARKGVVDGVVTLAELRDLVSQVLPLLPAATTPARSRVGGRTLAAEAGHRAAAGGPSAAARRVPVWNAVLLTREPTRPGVWDLLRAGGERVLPVHGTGAGERDRGVVVALTAVEGTPCVVVGQDRRFQRQVAPLGPAALRVARRGMRLAAELRLPLLTVIDTPGAEMSPAAEEGALAGEIARCLADLLALPVPRVSVILGEGTGGAALALLPAHRVLAAEHAWLAPLPPEGASAIVHHDADHAPEMVQRQRVGSWELAEDGIVDVVVPEPVPAHEDPDGFLAAVRQACGRELRALARTEAVLSG